MFKIQDLRSLTKEAETSIPEIKSSQVVVEDSHFVKFLQEHKPANNLLLVGVIPSTHFFGNDDAVRGDNSLLFFILKKASSKSITHDETLQMFEETQAACISFIAYLMEQKTTNQFCGPLASLLEAGINIDPVFNKSDCYGWTIDLNLVSNL